MVTGTKKTARIKFIIGGIIVTLIIIAISILETTRQST